MTSRHIARGTRKDNGEDVFGYYNKFNDEHFMLPTNPEMPDVFCGDNFVEITQEPDLWTGELTDNGDKIWQRDIVSYKSWRHKNDYVIEDCVKEHIAEDVHYTKITRTDVRCEQKIIGRHAQG